MRNGRIKGRRRGQDEEGKARRLNGVGLAAVHAVDAVPLRWDR